MWRQALRGPKGRRWGPRGARRARQRGPLPARRRSVRHDGGGGRRRREEHEAHLARQRGQGGHLAPRQCRGNENDAARVSATTACSATPAPRGALPTATTTRGRPTRRFDPPLICLPLTRMGGCACAARAAARGPRGTSGGAAEDARQQRLCRRIASEGPKGRLVQRSGFGVCAPPARWRRRCARRRLDTKRSSKGSTLSSAKVVAGVDRIGGRAARLAAKGPRLTKTPPPFGGEARSRDSSTCL